MRRILALMSAAARSAEGPVLKAVLALPRPALRAFAGPPIVLDGQTLDLEMQAVLRLEQLARLAGGGLLGQVPPEVARADTDRHAAIVGGRQRIGDVVDRDLPGPGGRIPIRVYTPSNAAPTGPGLVYFHGGGWVVGGLASHDAVCRFLAERSGVRLVAVDYRLAPEHAFPAAVEDCWAAYEWVRANAAALGVDGARVAVGGDSAGGNLAAVVALLGRDTGRSPAFQLLLYPAVDCLSESPSRRLFSSGFYLSTPIMDYSTDCYITNADDKPDPRVSPLRCNDLAGLCPAYITTAGFDPLRDEGEEYGAALAAAGVDVMVRRFEGLIHSFVNMVGIGTSAPAAMAEVADALRAGLDAGLDAGVRLRT